MNALLEKLMNVRGRMLLLVPLALVPVVSLGVLIARSRHPRVASSSLSAAAPDGSPAPMHDRRRHVSTLREDDAPVEPVLGATSGNGHTRHGEGSFEEF